MPIYEFYCADCKKDFEMLCSIRADLSLIVCSECNSKNVAKKVSAVAVIGGSKGDTMEGHGAAGHSSCGSCSTHSCGSCSH